jgi:hypothetical protein
VFFKPGDAQSLVLGRRSLLSALNFDFVIAPASCPLIPFPSPDTMPKIEVNVVAEILKKNEISPAILRKIVEEINLAVQPEGADEEKPPAVKKQFVILVSDPEGKLPKNDFVGWVLQIPEDESVATTQERIFRGSYDFNASKKGRLLPVKTVGEAIENVPTKFFKEADVWVKTKTPVLVLKTDNEIPKSDDGGGKKKKSDEDDDE